MKLAVTYENGQVFQHFGHTENFKIYTVENGAIVSSQVVSTGGKGHGALGGFLRDQGVSALICGGIGGGARTALGNAGITLYPESPAMRTRPSKHCWLGPSSTIPTPCALITVQTTSATTDIDS